MARSYRRSIGNIVIKLPLPPGCLPTLWNNDEGFQKSYLNRYSGYYLTADAGYKDEDGYLWIMSRTDDIIKCRRPSLSTGAMEEVLAAHPDEATGRSSRVPHLDYFRNDLRHEDGRTPALSRSDPTEFLP